MIQQDTPTAANLTSDIPPNSIISADSIQEVETIYPSNDTILNEQLAEKETDIKMDNGDSKRREAVLFDALSKIQRLIM